MTQLSFLSALQRFTRPEPQDHHREERQRKGSDGSQLLLVLSRQLSPGQGGVGDMQKDTVLPSSHRGKVPPPNSPIYMGSRQLAGPCAQLLTSFFSLL